MTSSALLVALLSLASPAPTSDGGTIVSRYIAAYGGQARLRKFSSVREIGTMVRTLNGQSQRGAFVLEEKAPNKSRFEYTFGGGRIVRAFDGASGWYMRPGLTEPEPVSEAERIDMADNEFAHPLIDYASRGIRVEFLGRAVLDGKGVFKLRVTKKHGAVEDFYLDQSTYRETRRDYISDGKVESVQYLREYRSIDGVLRPMVYEQGPENDPRRTVITVEITHINPELPDSRFRPPFTEPPSAPR